MTATGKSDTRELLVLLKLLSFNNKNTARNINKKHCCRKWWRNVKKHYYENELAKADFCALNCRQNISC